MNSFSRSFAVVLGLLAVDVVNVSAREETPFAAAVAKGDSLRNDEDFEAAVAAYSEAIQLNPNIAATYLGRGAAHEGRQQWDEAIADYKKAARLVHENREAYLALARVYYQLGKYRDAIIKYSVAIGLDPRDPEAYLDRAVVWRHAELPRASTDCDAAISIYSQAIKLARNSFRPYSDRGRAYAVRQYQTCGDADWQRAIADFHDAALYAETDRDKSRAYFLLGCAYRDTNKWDDSFRNFDLAISFGPTDSQVFFSRGEAYAIQGKPDKAIADFTQTIRLRPKKAEAYVRRGRLYAKGGETKKALSDFNEALRLIPNCVDAHFDRGWLYLRANDHENAIADFSQAIWRHGRYAPFGPDMSACYGSRGMALAMRGDLSESRGRWPAALDDFGKAVTDFTKAIQACRTDAPSRMAWIYSERGMAYEKEHLDGAAREDFEKAKGRGGLFPATVRNAIYGERRNDYGRLMENVVTVPLPHPSELILQERVRVPDERRRERSRKEP